MAYRAVVIGCGRIGGGYGAATGQEVASHASGYTRDSRVELVAAADLDPTARERFGKRWGSERLYADYEQMFAVEQVDIASICTWDEAHAGAVRAAANAGVRAILCEKPLAATASEAEELVRICAAAGTELFVGYQRRWEPAHRAVRDFIAAGGLGDILAVNGYYVGGLRHNGCAWINLARFLVGEIDTATAMVRCARPGEDMSIAVALQFAGGSSGSLLAADRDAYSVFEIDILGTLGRLRFSDAGETLEAWQVAADPRYPGFQRLVESQREWPQPQLREALNMSVASVVDWLEGSGQNESSGADAARDLVIVESALAVAPQVEIEYGR